MNVLTDEEILAAMTPDRYLPQTFARAIEAAVLAKLAAKDVEPVAYQHRDGMLSCRLPGGHVAGIDWTPLYTEAQYLAAQQRTAEACAKVCDEIAVTAWGCDSRFGEAVRNHWREHL